MKIAIACPASLPATQFGGIMFLAIEIARESTKMGNEAIVYTTDLDFANNAKVFNRDLPDDEIVEDVHIKRSHVWFKESNHRALYGRLELRYCTSTKPYFLLSTDT